MCVPSLHLVRIAPTALVACLAVLVVPSVVRGECGDYVIVGQPRLDLSELRLELRLKLLLQSAYSHDGPTDHRPSPPCHGPSCSRRDPAPGPSAPTAVVSTNTTDWAVLATGVSSRDMKPDRIFTVPILLLPERLPAPIEDPPRAG
jgi:hypothetical protein